jgi:hypothetical protein
MSQSKTLLKALRQTILQAHEKLFQIRNGLGFPPFPAPASNWLMLNFDGRR